MAISLVVDAGLEIHSLQIPCVPPFPRYLSGLHPRPVRVGGRSRELPHDVGVGEFPVLGGDNDDPPREGGRPVKFGDIILPCIDHLLHHIVPSDCRGVGDMSEIAAERRLSAFLVVVEKHSGIVRQVSLGEHYLHALRSLDKKWHYAPAILPPRKLRAGVGALEIVDEYVFETALPFLVDIGNLRVPVFSKAKIRLFVDDGELGFRKGREPVGAGVVVGTENDLISAPAFKFKLVEAFTDLGLFVRYRLGYCINAAGAGAANLRVRAAVEPAVAERHGGLRPIKQQRPLVEHVVADASDSRNVHFKRAVRRFQGICLRCGGQSDRRSRKH